MTQKHGQVACAEHTLAAESGTSLIAGLYRIHARALKSYIRSKFRDVDPDEIIQTVFLKLLKMANPPVNGNMRAYLFRTVDSVVADQYDRRRVRSGSVLETVQEQEHDHPRLRDTLTPERIVSDKRELELVIKALKDMPGHQSQLLMMRGFAGMSCAEIARRTGQPERNVQRHMIKATQTLNMMIAGMETADE